MCILTRILEGVGNAGATLASTSILSQVLDGDNIAEILGRLFSRDLYGHPFLVIP